MGASSWSAAEADELAYDVIVQEATDYDAVSLSDEDNRSRIAVIGTSKAEDNQEVWSFLLDPGQTVQKDDTFSVQSPERFDSDAWAPVQYLASNYGDIDGRIREAGGDSPVKQYAERAAFQLAIWELVKPGFLKSLPATSVTGRAAYLADLASEQSADSSDPSIARAHLIIKSVSNYPNGETFRLRLSDTRKDQGLGGQVVTLLVNGRAQNAQVTDDNGSIIVDVPSQRDYLGTITGQWLSRLPPGTFLKSEDDKWMVLLESLPIEVLTDAPADHQSVTKADLVKIYPSLALRWLGEHVRVGWMYFGLFVVLVGIPGLVVAAGEGAKGRRLGLYVCSLVVGCAVAAYLMGTWQEEEFDPTWSRVQPVGQVENLEVGSVMGSSKRISNRYPTAYNWPCVADDSRTTPWVSNGERGPLETVALDFGRPVQVEELQFIMGWPDAAKDYKDVGKPSRLELIGQSGQVNQVQVEARSWSNWREPVVVDLRQLSRSPIKTRVLYVRTLSIVGGVKTNFGISDIKVRGQFLSTDAGLAPTGPLTSAFKLSLGEGCGFRK